MFVHDDIASYNKFMKIGFFADTPLQVLNCIKIAFMYPDDKKDIYIVKQFRASSDIIDNLKSINIFDNVYYTELEKKEKHHSFYEIIGLSFPNIYNKHIWNGFTRTHYDLFFSSLLSRTVDLLLLGTTSDQLIAYDDGSGSYGGINYFDTLYHSFKYSKVRKALNKRQYTIADLYLCNPSAYNGGKNYNLHKINNSVDKSQVDILNFVFNRKDTDQYRKHKIIYLNQPISDRFHKENYIKTEEKILTLLSTSFDKENILVRLHPRETTLELYKEFSIDHINNMWELECNESITDNHLLIATCSTAQLSPKLLYNQEPFLIFTYLLYDSSFSSDEKRRINNIIEKIKDLYHSKEKVMVPKTFDELKENIQNVKFIDNFEPHLYL